METPLLHIKNLSIRFRGSGALAVDNLSLTVRRGEVLAIVGESGSGKSVTALSILKLLAMPPASYESGEVLFSTDGIGATNLLSADETDMQHLRGKDIAMIFQEPMTSLNPVLTCGEQVMEAMLAHLPMEPSSAAADVVELFRTVQLPAPEECFRKYPHQLSGGQKQRVMIAMAISCRPSLLICDEPTTALDVTVQKEILLLLKQLQREENMGMIFITHDLGVVSEIADTIAVMHRGRLVELNIARQLLSNPEHPYTRALIACRPARALPGSRLPVVDDFLDFPNGGLMKAKDVQDIEIRQAAAQIERHEERELVRVSDLMVSYAGRGSLFGNRKRQPAVNKVSFSIYRGEALGLVGESGCGKSTLGKALLRLIPADSGRIVFDGKDILTLSSTHMRELRTKMQIIFQDPFSALSPRMKVGQALDEVLSTHTKLNATARKVRVLELLGKVGLPAEHYNRYPHEFSGGQRQRIVIARALAMNPSFIVCDESVSALDVSVQAQVLNLLNDLRREYQFTLLFISHDLSVIRYFCDRVMVMQAGSIVETGPAEDVYQHPSHPYTRKLLASIPAAL